jgi:O-6-methylguanine DNA methyltransferase
MPSPRTRARELSTQRDATTTPAAEHARTRVLDGGAIGRVVVRFVEAGITDARFARNEPLAVDAPSVDDPPYIEALRRYLAGEPVAFDDVPLALTGTDFQRRVWDALRTIPYGRVVSYAHIAKRVGVPRGMRAVGLANGRNPVPIIVPCHRVVEATGALGGFSGGLDIKRLLLTLEGVGLNDDRVQPGQRSLF